MYGFLMISGRIELLSSLNIRREIWRQSITFSSAIKYRRAIGLMETFLTKQQLAVGRQRRIQNPVKHLRWGFMRK